MSIKIRKAKVSDIHKLQEKLFKMYQTQLDLGVRDLSENVDVLWGGATIEIGTGFSSPEWLCVLADRNGELIGFIIARLEFCSPVARDLKCVRVHAQYLEESSLAGGRVLSKMWELIQTWAKENGAGHFYANIHPGNQSSIRAAKKVGFRHHYTQFYKSIEEENLNG